MKSAVRLIVTLAVLLTLSAAAYATDVRGRINGINPYTNTPYPLPGMSVDLFLQGSSGWQPVGRYITGSDGMYYFDNIYPPGSYVLQVNGRQNYPVMIIDQSYQDLPPILITY